MVLEVKNTYEELQKYPLLSIAIGCENDKKNTYDL
jgi:hypothetical protein